MKSKRKIEFFLKVQIFYFYFSFFVHKKIWQNIMSNLEKIFAIGNETIQKEISFNRATIYKKELFEGKTDKEKKSIRIKLRKKRDAFLSTFLVVEKDKNKLEALKKDWKEYAKLVYNNIEIIMDNNTNKESVQLIKRFVSVMKK